jgi:hypothetical protein
VLIISVHPQILFSGIPNLDSRSPKPDTILLWHMLVTLKLAVWSQQSRDRLKTQDFGSKKLNSFKLPNNKAEASFRTSMRRPVFVKDYSFSGVRSDPLIICCRLLF